MKPLNKRWLVGTAVLALVLVTSGCPECNDDERPQEGEHAYVIKCDKQTQALTLYDATTSNGLYIETLKPGGLPGHKCSVSSEEYTRAHTLSDAIENANLVAGGQAKISAPAVSTTRTSLVNSFPWLEPLLFAPLLAATDSSKLQVNCKPSLQAYMVNHVEGTVTAFGICPLRVLKEIQVRSSPLQVALTPDGALALVTSYDGAVTFIDTATNTVKATLDLTNYNPSGIAISPDGTRAYVTHYLDTLPVLLVIDIPNVKLLSTIPLPQPYPRTVVLTPDGSQAWVNYYTGGVVTVVDLLTGIVAGTVNTSLPVSTGMAFNPTGTKAFLAVYPNQIYVVDTATLAVQTRITVGQSPSDVVMTVGGARVLVNSEVEAGNWWIDARTNKLLGHSTSSGGTAGSLGLLLIQ
jgi:YVTN family beta-propeller protein